MLRSILQNLCVPNPADIGKVGNSEKGVIERKRKKNVINYSMFSTKHHCEFSNFTTSNEWIEKWKKKNQKKASVLSKDGTSILAFKKKEKKPHSTQT